MIVEGILYSILLVCTLLRGAWCLINEEKGYGDY